jgi:hypothetical protein
MQLVLWSWHLASSGRNDFAHFLVKSLFNGERRARIPYQHVLLTRSARFRSCAQNLEDHEFHLYIRISCFQ